MKVTQQCRREGTWQGQQGSFAESSQLVLAFSSRALLTDSAIWTELRSRFPQARIVACSTAGEIIGTEVLDNSLICTGIEFEHASVQIASLILEDPVDSETLGEQLAARLPTEELRHVFVLSEGLRVNGSSLLQGLIAGLPPQVHVTGGFAGDGSRFGQTAVCVDGPSPASQVVAVGLYGARLRIGYGSQGGWDAFGVERKITKSLGHVVHELDGSPALDLYQRYLGEQAIHLPASGLRFPLAIRDPAHPDAKPIVRTILGIDEQSRSLIFAGDMPTGFHARLMSANMERLLDGAREAGLESREQFNVDGPQLAILISCVGRKLVLDQRVEEEVEEIAQVFGTNTTITGFYSYGELSPFSDGPSLFHNQTMTITTLSES